MQIYTELTRRGVLTDEHREQLKRKRGFTDETIDTLRFFSCGEELKATIESMLPEYGMETAVASGLFSAEVSPPQVAAHWKKSNVVIPYRDGDDVVYIRAHKFGPKGVPVRLYCPTGAVPSGRVILCESEFKAAAAWQLGFNAVGMPGIWSFTRNHWDEMKQAFERAGVTEVIVCFDNEDKSNPALDSFKADPMKRHDAQYCSYLFAYLFQKAGISSSIATLPDSWRIGGKADIDGALAAGKTRPDFEAVFASAVKADTYLDSLPEEASHAVRNKLNGFFMKSKLEARHNCYWWSVMDKDGNQKQIKVSNFVLEIVATYDDPTAVNRAVVFVDQNGKRSRLTMIEPEAALSPMKFREWAVGKGNYIWQGSDAALQALWLLLFADHGDRVIYRPDHVGLIDGGNIWLFGNCAVMAKTGEVVMPDEDGIIYADGQGYKAITQDGDSRAPQVGARDSRPRLYLGNDSLSLPYLADAMVENFGSYAPAVGLGWVIATIYSEDLYRLWDQFPFLFLFGKRRGGKTTLSRFLRAICGIEVEGDDLSESTQTGIGRTASYFSSLPYGLEEYRNEQRIKSKGSYLRAAYNRSGASKGIKAEFGTRSVRFRSTLLICGEDTPDDAALLSRCIVLGIEESQRRGSRYDELHAKTSQFSGAFVPLIRQRATIIDALKERTKAAKDYLRSHGVGDDRTASNWAVPIATYSTMVKEDPDFVRWAIEAARVAHKTNEEELTVNRYLNDLAAMLRAGRLNGAHMQNADIRVDSDRFYLRSSDVYNKWVEDYRRRGGEPMKSATIDSAMKDVPGWLGKKKARVPRDAPPSWCHVFDLNNRALPDALAEMAGRDNGCGDDE